MITYLLRKTDYRTEARPYGYPYRGMDNMGTAIDRFELNFHDSGNVQFRNTSMYYGKATSGKNFTRWKVTNSINFKHSAVTGRPVVTQRTQTNRYYGGAVGIQSFLSAFAQMLRDYGAVYETIDPEHRKILEDIHHELSNPPMGHLYGDLPLALWLGPRGSYPWVFFATPADAAVTLFGKTRYRKDLVKTIGRTNIDALTVAHAFRGLVPIDWLINLMRESEGRTSFAFETDYRYIRPVLKKMNERELRRLLNDTLRVEDINGIPNINVRTPRLITDISRYVERYGVDQLNFDGVRSWNDVHDRIWEPTDVRPFGVPRPARRIPAPREIHKIEPVQLAKDIHAAFEGSEYVHVMPEDSNTLNEWSDLMGNCIRGYDYRAAKGTCILGAIYKSDKMLANYEVDRNGGLNQLLGKHNRHLDTADHDVVVSLLQKAGVNIDTEYWGKPSGVAQYAGNW